MNRPLRAVIGIPYGTRKAGAEGMLWTLLRHRDAANLEPHVVFFADGPFRSEVAALGIPTSVIDPGRYRQPWRLAGAIARMAGLLRSERPDVCVSWLNRVQTVMAPAAALTGNRRRVVLFEHEVPTPNLIRRAAVGLPCAYVVASSRGGSEASRRIWPHRDSTHVWPGIEPPPRPPDGAVAALRDQLELPAGRPVLGIVGRLVGWKGQDRLIEAVGLLRDRGVDVTLLVIGGETYGVDAGIEQRLRELVTRLRLEDRVVFCGHVSEPWTHMGLLDVLVSASDGEPFGIVLLEAMAMGVPVVAVDRHGPSEILTPDTGILVPTPAPQDLAAGIERLLADPELARRLTQAARERQAACFTPERMACEIGDALAAVANRAR